MILSPEERALLAQLPLLRRIAPNDPRTREALALRARIIEFTQSRAKSIPDMTRAAKVERVRRQTGAPHPRKS